MKKGIMKVSVLLVAVIIMTGITAVSFAGDSDGNQVKTIKVARFSAGDYFKVGKSGNVTGYDPEYLDKISQYSKLKFEFVNCGTWENALEKLKNREVDLVGTMQRSSEREKEYEICTNSYGTTYATIATLKDSKYVYEDYDAMGKAAIGCVSGYVREPEMNDLFRKKGIAPDIKYYKNYPELEKAFKSGKVDMIAVNSHTLDTDYKIIEKYAYQPFYFASWKGNADLISDMDEAITNISVYEPTFENNTMQKYFTNINNSPFTKQELSYIKSAGTKTIYFEKDTKPIAYLGGGDEMKGIMIDICSRISRDSGIKFKYKAVTPGVVKELPLSEENRISYEILTPERKKELIEKDVITTDSLFDCEYSLYAKTGMKYDPDKKEKRTVALPKNRFGFDSYFKANFPNYTIMHCNDPKDCLDKVDSGIADFAFLNDYVAERLIADEKYSDIKDIYVTRCSFGIALTVKDEELASVINKSRHAMSQNDIYKIILDNSTATKQNPTVLSLIQENPVGFVILILIIFVIALTIGIGAIRYRTMRREKKAINDVNAQLARANMEAEYASKAKSEFLSNMSHEIRTPLNTVIGVADIGGEEVKDKKAVYYFGQIESAGRYLLSLINDILDMSRIENGKIEMHKKATAISDILKSTEGMMRAIAEEKNVSIVTRFSDFEEPVIMCDGLRVRQIMINLLNNAIKFSEDGKNVDWIVDEQVQNSSIVNVKIQIKDRGCGMSEDFQKRLFQPFEQERRSAGGQKEGTGLGLAITKNLTEQMEGTIEVESAEGKGSCFTVVIPFAIADTAAFSGRAEDAGKKVRPLKDVHILAVEDHKINLDILKRMLESEGVIVETAGDGAEAVDTFSSSDINEFDMILMDVRMPKMDGLEATRVIRRMVRADSRKIPIIAITANAFSGDIRICIDAGMDDHIAKPVDKRTLIETIQKYLT